MQIRESNLPLFTCDCSDHPPLVGPLKYRRMSEQLSIP